MIVVAVGTVVAAGGGEDAGLLLVAVVRAYLIGKKYSNPYACCRKQASNNKEIVS